MGLTTDCVVQGFRGKYRIAGLIASGGLGRVWRARSDKGVTVAIKEPLTEGSPDQVRINCEKLKIEAVLLERLTGIKPLLLSQQHQAYSLEPRIQSHIVKFIDVDKDALRPNGEIFPHALVMEYIEGQNANDVFRHSHDPGRVENYWEDLLRIVNSLHENYILHRDISPHNLMLTGSLRDPVLIDFGTAKEGFNQLSDSDMSIVIHPGYSAPELGTGQAFPSSDLYSVGATSLFMYTGVIPQQLLNSAGQLDTSRRSQLRTIQTDRLSIIQKAMSFNPHDRYQTAEDMLDALERRISSTLPSHLIASGRKYVIEDELTIGRSHASCNRDCRKKGFSEPPDIALIDPEGYVSRHHAIVRRDVDGDCFIEEIPAAPSGTAIKHAVSKTFQRLQPGREYELEDGDVIAIAFSPVKGAYRTVFFRES